MPAPRAAGPGQLAGAATCLTHRGSQRTSNPHVIVTRRASASTAYISHVLGPCAVPPRTLRCTRLADLVNAMDPKLVAAAFGMNPEGVIIYLADYIDDGRLPPAGRPRARTR